MSKSWYGAKGIFRHLPTNFRRQLYEERIILLQAKNFEAAIKKADKEARKYSETLENCEYAGYVDVFELFDDKVGDKTEVYSSMQTSDLLPSDYLTHFYPATPQDCESDGESHRWFNRDDSLQACYHCQITRKSPPK